MPKPLVLFVDDDTNLLRSWSRTFAQEPYTMLFATSGSEALKILSGLKAAVVVTDYSMRNGDGIQLLERIQAQFPEMTRILVSGHATLSVAQDAINRCGVHKLFEKPCNVVELGVAIREGIKACRLPDSASTVPSITELERAFPGITQVKRTLSGAIEI